MRKAKIDLRPYKSSLVPQELEGTLDDKNFIVFQYVFKLQPDYTVNAHIELETIMEMKNKSARDREADYKARVFSAFPTYIRSYLKSANLYSIDSS